MFATADAGKSFAPVIVLGLEAGANLFLDESGEWDRSAYFPAYVRRFPFCLSKERVVCIVKSYIDAGGVPLYDALARLELLESFSVQVKDMGLIYAHLHSLENFSRLAARWNLRRAGGRG